MRSVVCSLLLALVGWLCLVTVCCSILNVEPPLPIPPRYGSVVLVVACLWSLHLAVSSLEFLGKVGLFISAAPLFVLSGVIGFAVAGPVGGAVGFLLPLVIALKYGFIALAAVTVASVALFVFVASH